MSLSPDDAAALLRWRLALGPESEEAASELGLAALGGYAGTVGLEEGGEGGLGDLDEALSFVYGGGTYGRGGNKPYLPKWLGLVRKFFREDVIALVQKDAIEKKGLTQLLFEPETLPYLEKNVDLVSTLLSAKGLVPDQAKDVAREIVREVVEELRKKLETETRTAIYGAVRRNTDSPLELARNIDWKRTIQKNLKGWDKDKKRLVPDRFYFWSNQRKRHEWEVILMDQSGSMAVSCVYSSSRSKYAVAGLVKDYKMPGYPDHEPMIPHGVSVVVNAPATFRWTESASPERHREAADALGAEDLGAHLEKLMRDARVPVGLESLGYDERDVRSLVGGTIVQRRLLDNAPRDSGEAELHHLFTAAMR